VKRFVGSLFLIASLSLAALAEEPVQTESTQAILQKRPVLAVWQDHPGMTDQPHGASLRVAIWDDGTVVFNKDLSDFGRDLQRGKIAPYRLALLKHALERSAAFSLKETGYAVPDAEGDCILFDLGAKGQVLNCEEGLLLNHSGPEYRELKKCWETLNDLAILSCPDQFEPVPEKFTKTPDSWRIERQK
jgi:hypothetical protein